MIKMVIHDNTWFWGRAKTIVLAEGKAMCRVAVDNSDNRCWLENLTVHPSIRRKSYGTELMEIAEAEARKMGCKEIYLLVDAPAWTQKWYERRGYTVHHHEDDGLPVMVKKLRRKRNETV